MMHIRKSVLSRYTDLPDSAHDTRVLLDEVGLEVKRVTEHGDDLHISLELLANRGDHHCYEGLAREITGRTGGELRVPEYTELSVGDSPWPVRVETDLVLAYSATLLVKQSDGSLGAAELATLESNDIHSLGAVIDSTNLSNLEFGQPTHAFDADKIDGAIVLRTSRAGETAWPLFAEGAIELKEGTLVVADESKILAIAGVIGCEESKTTDSTTRVLLESATFDPVAVRKGARSHNLHTDSSARFERGADPARPLLGAGRVVMLLEGAGWAREGATGLFTDWTDPERTIEISAAATARYLGVDLSAADIGNRLQRYGFGVGADGDQLRVQVPTWRLWDVEFPADLYEELAKSIGYDNTPVTLPQVERGSLPEPEAQMKSKVESVLFGLGFYEVITDGFYGRALPQQLGFDGDHALSAHVETANALDRAYSLLKNNGLGQAVELVAFNGRHALHQIKAFEWTRTFHPDPSVESGARERKLLWGVVSGDSEDRTWAGGTRPADAIFLRGVVEELARELQLPLTLSTNVDRPVATALHPNRRAAIVLNGQEIGVLGEVHPAAIKAFKLKKKRPAYFELDVSGLLRPGQAPVFVEPDALHPMNRSLAFTLQPRVEAGGVADAIQAAGPDNLDRVRIVDLFAHEEDGVPVRTITFDLRFESQVGASADEVNAQLDAIIAAVEALPGVALRR